MSYTIAEISNQHYADQAHNMGTFVSTHATRAQADAEAERLNQILDNEYDQYDCPYNSPPFSYVVFNTNDHQ